MGTWWTRRSAARRPAEAVVEEAAPAEDATAGDEAIASLNFEQRRLLVLNREALSRATSDGATTQTRHKRRRLQASRHRAQTRASSGPPSGRAIGAASSGRRRGG